MKTGNDFLGNQSRSSVKMAFPSSTWTGPGHRGTDVGDFVEVLGGQTAATCCVVASGQAASSVPMRGAGGSPGPEPCGFTRKALSFIDLERPDRTPGNKNVRSRKEARGASARAAPPARRRPRDDARARQRHAVRRAAAPRTPCAARRLQRPCRLSEGVSLSLFFCDLPRKIFSCFISF